VVSGTPGTDPIRRTTVFLEHFIGFPAAQSALAPSPAVHPADPLLDPLLLGVLTAAVEDESTDAYQQGFRDGLRAAALMPDDPDGAEAADLVVDEGDWHR
jgi:hypothetical protein